MKEENSTEFPQIDFKLSTILKTYKDVDKIKLNEKYSLENLNLTEITGEAGSGKTQLCIHIIINTILPKSIDYLEKGCLYISTIHKLPTQRFYQVINSYNKTISKNEIDNSLKRLFNKHFEPNDFEKFFNVEVEEFILKNNIKVIIIDSMTGICDLQFINENNVINYKERAIFIRIYSQIFKRLIQKYNLFFFCTNNVQANLNDNNNNNNNNSYINLRPCLGKIWENQLNTRISLEHIKKNEKDLIRKLKIHFSNYFKKIEIQFEITNKGMNFI